MPAANKSTAVGIVTAASYAGTALAFGISPLLIANFGWQTVYYAFGASALLWLPFWLPAKDAAGAAAASAAAAKEQQQLAPPSVLPALSALLKRREVQAICVAQYCQSWGMYGLLTWLPTFFSDYYGVQLSDLGSYTLVPYVVQGGVGIMAGFIADSLIVRRGSVRQTRILLQVNNLTV